MLSFGEEAEEDETLTNDFVQKNATKSKSVFDIDPKLSKEAAQNEKKRELDDDHFEENPVESDDEVTLKEKTDRIRDKLKKLSKSDQGAKSRTKPKDEPERESEPEPEPAPEPDQHSDSDSDDYTNELEKERKLKRQKKA